MATKFSGATKIEIQQAGGDFSSPDVVIPERHVRDDTAVEVEENTDQTDPTGNSPHSGQFANVTVHSDDMGARSTLVGYRTGSPETLVDARFHFPDGNGGTETITAEKMRAKTMLQPMPSEKGQVNTWVLESTTYVTGVVGFD